jgi:hypothetical protein
MLKATSTDLVLLYIVCWPSPVVVGDRTGGCLRLFHVFFMYVVNY